MERKGGGNKDESNRKENETVQHASIPVDGEGENEWRKRD